MSDSEEDKGGPVTDPVVEKVEDTLDDDKGGKTLSLAHLKELEDRLQARIDVVSKDNNKDAEEKAELKAHIEKLSEHIETLIKAQETKDKEGSKSTLVVPEKELGESVHTNKPETETDTSGENSTLPPKKGKWRWY